MSAVPGSTFAVALAAMIGITSLDAVAAADLALSSPGSRNIQVEPGARTSFVLRFSNLGDQQTAPVRVTALLYLSANDYALAFRASSPCGTIVPGGPNLLPGVHFFLPSLAPGQTLECEVEVLRASASHSDIGLFWRAETLDDADSSNDSASVNLGSFADIGVRVDPLNFALDSGGVGHALVRLTARNFGPTAVIPFAVGMCVDNFFPEFAIDGEFAGGCGSAEFSPACFDSGFGFRVPAQAPGEAYSCELRLRGFSSYAGPLHFPLKHTGGSRAGGGFLIDTDPDNDYAFLTLGPIPAPQAVAPVPALRWPALVALAIAIVLATGVRRAAASMRS